MFQELSCKVCNIIAHNNDKISRYGQNNHKCRKAILKKMLNEEIVKLIDVRLSIIINP